MEWAYNRLGLPRDCFYNDQCKLHDALYGTLTPRKEADEIFLDAMLLKAKGNKRRILEARIYYKLVRLFGWAYYKGLK